MQQQDRRVARARLDRELRPLRMMAKAQPQTRGHLRAVRQALGMRAGEMADRMSMHRSVLYRLEESELAGTISMGKLQDVAAAMGCVLVYGIVPSHGETLEELAGCQVLDRLAEKGDPRAWNEGDIKRILELPSLKIEKLLKAVDMV